MNIIERLFRGGTVETNTVVEELEAEERRKREEQAAVIARERQQTAEYRARITEGANERRARLNESLDELGDLVPRLILACAGFTRIAAEVQEKGLGFEPGPQLLEDIFCIPPDFGTRLTAAIQEICPRTQWDFAHTGPQFGKAVKAERPKLKGPIMMRVPRFAGDMAPPPGFNGVWDCINHRPMDPNDEVPFVILPTG